MFFREAHRVSISLARPASFSLIKVKVCFEMGWKATENFHFLQGKPAFVSEEILLTCSHQDMVQRR